MEWNGAPEDASGIAHLLPVLPLTLYISQGFRESRTVFATMMRRQHQRSHAIRSVSLLLPVLLFMLPSAQCNNFHVRHRTAAVVATAATSSTIDTTVVERCMPDSTYTALYRCSYGVDTADTRLTALCPAPLIDTKCRCAIAAISPLTGSFQQCSACEIIEYMEEWSVTYDCSNLWLAQEPPEEGGGKATDEEEEAIFAEAGGLDTTAATIPDTPAPTPSVRLVARNSRTSPPYLFPTGVRKLAVLPPPPPPQEDAEYAVASSKQSTAGNWMSYWQNILGG
jgi:hypothetical protein